MLRKCAWCGESAEGAEALLHHIQKEHAPKASTSAAGGAIPEEGAGAYKCSLCVKVYKTRSSLNRHVRETHGETKQVCKICREVFKSVRVLKQHTTLKHASVVKSSYKCKLCGGRFNREIDLVSHKKRKRCSPQGAECRHCLRRFKDVRKLYAHKRQKHASKVGRYVCTGCLRRYHTPAMWQQHMRMCRETKSKHVRFQALRKKFNMTSEWESISALQGDARVHTLNVTDEFDVQLSLLKNKCEMEKMLQNDMEDLRRIKWYAIAYILCQTGEGDKGEPVKKYLRCSNIVTLLSENIAEDVEKAILGLINSFDKMQGEGSSILFERVEAIELRVAKYSPLKGSSYLPLPEWLRKSSKGLINIKNFADDKCFLWSCLAGIQSPRIHPERVAYYKVREQNLKMKGIKYPVKLRDISKFEVLNPHVSVTVFGLEDEKQVVPLRVSSSVKTNHINLLLLQEGEDSHYVLIKDLSRFLAHLTKWDKALYWCENCLTPRENKEKHEEHRKRCLEQEAQAIKMPEPKDTFMKFRDHGSRLKHDYVIYCDLEAVLQPYSTAVPNPERSSTTRVNQHIPCGYCYVIMCSDGTFLKEPVLEHGENIIQRLLVSLKKEEADIMERRGPEYPLDMTPESTAKFEAATHCCACHDRIPRAGVLKVRHHDHGKEKDNYIGAACSSPCNLNLKRRNFIPVIMHNLSGYDAHHIISTLGELSDGSDLSVIPKTKEKYISFQWGQLRFLDSFGFLSSSLDSLAKDLKPEEMEAINLMFPQPEKQKLASRKGIYPYQYFDSFEKFEERQLPPRSAYRNDLTGEELSQEEYDVALTVWNTFKMETLYDLHDYYLLTDTLILCDIFENYRKSSLKWYDLDVAHFYTTPGFSMAAAMSFTKQTLELITDIDIHLMFEKGVRGGVASINGRFAEANNPYVPETYDASKQKSYIMYYDCNALYASAMIRKLPVGGFRFLSPEEIEGVDIMSLSEEDTMGYLIEADLLYPDYLHNDHNDFCLAPEHLVPKYENLSRIQKKMHKKYEMNKNSKTRKLVPNLCHKDKYVVYGMTLQLYLKLGMKLKKIHRVIEFEQEAWLTPYIHHNIEMRKKATTDFGKAFFKLLNNAVYGKMLETVRTRRNVVLTKEQEKFRKLVKSPLYHSFEIFDHGMVAVERRKATVVLNRPIYVGQVILDISKQIMFNFHYNVMKPMYGKNIQVLGTDTDSLIYKILTDDVYEDMATMMDHFDTSDYDKAHPLYSLKNKKVLEKFTDEMSGIPIKAFVGLKPKMYSFSRVDDKEKCVGKGVPKSALKKQLSFNDYYSCLKEQSLKMVSFNKISTDQKHHLYQTHSSKRALTAFDDKRYILADNQTTLAYGHYRIRDAEETVDSDDSDCDDEDVVDKLASEIDDDNENCRNLYDLVEMIEGMEKSGEMYS